MRTTNPGPGPTLLVLALVPLLGACDAPTPRFSDVSADSGLDVATFSGTAGKSHIRETLGQGVCVIDHDRDGDADLFVPNGAAQMPALGLPPADGVAPWAFYVRDRDRFREAGAALNLRQRAWAIGCAVGDVDGDGWDDLYVTTADSPNRLLRNRQGRGFEDITAQSGTGLHRLSTSAAFADLDADTDLDLFVVTYLDEAHPPPSDTCRWRGIPVMCGPRGFPQTADRIYWNDGHGVFTEQTLDATGFGLAALVLDADADGDPDVYVANDSSPNHLWLNAGDGTLNENGFAAGVALSMSGATQAGMGVDAGDLNGDQLQEIIVTNFSHDINNVYTSIMPGVFEEWSHRLGMAQTSFRQLGWSVLMEDFDLDGDLDVFLVNGHVFPQVEQHPNGTEYAQPLQLLLNDGTGSLSPAPSTGTILDRPIAGRGAATADWDGDGDLDIVVTRDQDTPLLLRNDLPPDDAHWLRVRLHGPPGNPHALGARVELETGDRVQVREIRANRGYLSASEPVAHFGLGRADRIDRLSVTWPSGQRQTRHGLAPDRTLDLAPGQAPGQPPDSAPRQ